MAGATTLGLAGAALMLATLNKIISQNAPAPQAPLALDPQRYDWSEGEISYTVAGQGPAIILLHGIYTGASSFEFRRIFTSLSRQFRVFAPDLPGFGLSASQHRTYNPDLFVKFIYDFSQQVAGGADHPVHLIASALSCTFAIEAAANRPDLFDRIILIEPAGVHETSRIPSTGQILLGELLRTPILGTSLYNALVSRSGLRYFLARQVYHRRDEVTDDLIDTYYAMSHQPNTRFAIASLVGGGLNLDIGDVFELLPQPILLCWGSHARISPLEHAEAFKERNDNAELAIFDHSSGMPHDEEPEDFVAQVQAWLRSGISSRH
jgi:pimeloyl-ACP methyl ester carboxylesterase